MSILSRRELFRLAFGGLVGAAVSKEKEIAFSSTVLYYHELSRVGLRNNLIGRIRAGQQPLSLETFIKTLNGELEIPYGLQTFLLTWDDGLASQYYEGLPAILDVERETGWFVPPVVFTMTKFQNIPLPVEEIPDDTPSYSDRVHRYMTKGQLIELVQNRCWVDNHTVDHGNLPSLSWGARNAQVEDGQERIDVLWKIAGREKPYKAFAYPYGNYYGQVEYIRDLDYDVAFSTLRSTYHIPKNRHIIGRIG